MSRRHAEIDHDNDAYWAQDVGSLNGTYLNRERIDTSSLSSGDELQVGKFRLLFLAPGQGPIAGHSGRQGLSGKGLWAKAVSSRSHLSIGEVLSLLQDEFPDVTISKIRFLESQGLVDPERTPSGYRKFYEADIDRLRWVLRQQRDAFLPLKVIKGRLDSQGDLSFEEADNSFEEAGAEFGGPGVWVPKRWT